MSRGPHELLRRLRSLLASGVPVRDAFGALAQDARLARRAGPVRDALARGADLAEALGQPASGLRPEQVALLVAGERSGRLVEVLERLLEDLSRRAEARRQVARQTAYPVLVLAVALVLPPLALWTVTGTVLEGVGLHVAGGVALVLCGLLAWRGPALVPAGSAPRRALERLGLALPVLRGLVLDRELGRALWLEGELLRAGLGFDEGLALVRDAAGWQRVGAMVEAARADIAGGRKPAEAHRHLGLSAELQGRLASADQAGRLDEALREAGEELRGRHLHRLEITFRVVPVVLYLLAMLVILQVGLTILGDVSGRL